MPVPDFENTAKEVLDSFWTDLFNDMKPVTPPLNTDYVKYLDKATSKLTQLHQQEMLKLIGDDRLPAYKNGVIVGKDNPLSSNMADSAIFGSGYNTAKAEIRTNLNKAKGE